MAKTILRVRQGHIAFYINEGSKGGKGGRRLSLCRTSEHGKIKDGLVRINSTTSQALVGAGSEAAQFEACAQAFEAGQKRAYFRQGEIRGRPGPWEGAAFPKRKPARHENECAENVARNGGLEHERSSRA